MNISHYPVDSNRAKLLADYGTNQSKYLESDSLYQLVVARAITARSIASIIPQVAV